MRILVLSDLPQFVRGGAEMQAARLAGSWARAGHEVRCLGRRMSGSEVVINGQRIAIARIPMINGLGRWVRGLSFFLSLGWLLLKHRAWADVIYCRFLGEAATTAAALKALRLLSMPLVATPANVGGTGDAMHLKSVIGWQWIVGLLDRHVDAINLIAPDMVAELQSVGFSGANFQRIPNGIAVAPLFPATHAQRRWIFIGRLTRQKAIDLLIEALSSLPLPEDAPDILIIGDGPERERLIDKAHTCAWRQRLRFLGSLPPEEVPGLLATSELFLLPSRYEGMSNAGLEAMERGLPVMLSRCGGLDQYITSEHGWVVPVENMSALRRALAEALEAPPERLAEMGAACRRLVETNFDMSSVAMRYLALFATLIARNTDGKQS